MLQVDPTQRPTAEELLKNKWFYMKEHKVDEEGRKIALQNLLNFKVTTSFQKAMLIFFIRTFDLQKERNQLLKIFKELDINHDG